MKKILSALLLTFFFGYQPTPEKLSEKDKYRLSLNSHAYLLRPNLTPAQIKEMPKRDRPDLGWEQNFLATMDPALGRPAPERLLAIYHQVSQSGSSLMSTPGGLTSPWVERGPNNVAGRTRAIMYDPNDITLKKVWAGGVTGGLWYNNDISSSSSQWIAVNDFWDNIAITSIAYDPNNTNIFYVGTGEGWGTGSSRGAGIWKTTDGGSTWTHLSATSNFHYVNDLAVRDESGTSVLYVALRSNYYGQTWHGSSSQGLQRSINGGSSFTQVLPNVPGESFNYVAADIEIGADNKLWVGTTTTSYGGTDRGGGRVLSSTNGSSWTVSYAAIGSERVEVACAPNDANYVYAIIEAGNEVDEIIRTTNNGSTWINRNEPNDADNGIPSTDFSRGQAWYDLILAVDPNNKNTIIAGAIDLFRSTDGAGNWSQISKWSNNNNLAALNCSEVHADQHTIVFKPGSSSEVLFGNDGGVYYTSSVSTGATSNVIFARNSGYNVTQFYACAIHPTAGSNYALAGAQDNGSQQFSLAGVGSTIEVTGGDGAFCFIDQTDPNYQITSYVYNSYYLFTNGGTFFPTSIQSDQTTGKFINPADYDDNLNILYSGRTATTINRISGINTTPLVGDFTVSGMSTEASHLRVSPYTTASTTLFVGTGAGDVFKVTNADGASPSATSIGAALPAGNISCIEIGASENELLVTLSNYGLASVWYTNDGGTTWINKEGNLPDMPVRWALFNPSDRSEVILATEVGIWSTSNINAGSPNWISSNSGLANVRVDMLQIRDSDKEVLAATYGRGLFTSSGFNVAQAPSASIGYSNKYPCTGETVSLGDSSLGNPSSWSWSITPSTFTFNSGSTANSQHPELNFTAPGWYDVKLVISNPSGSDSIVISQAIRAGGKELPVIEDFEGTSVSEWGVINPDNLNTWGLYTISGTTPGNTAAAVDNFNYNAAGQRDGLISPALDLSSYTGATLSFEYAYRRYDSSFQDSLAVYISTDCGANWIQIASYRENGTGNFVTGADFTSSFSPTGSSDWCGSATNPACPSLDISSYTGNPNVKIKIENICGFGNNLFVDNINITGTISSAPLADFTADKTVICQGDTVVFSDLTTNAPTTWAWTFSPSTITYVNGTSASSQHPEVLFNAGGNYQVSLTATNALGNDTKTKTAYIMVNSSLTPTVTISTADTVICEGLLAAFTANITNGGSNPFYQWKVNGNNAGLNVPGFSSSTLNNGDVVSLEITSNAGCASPSTVISTGIAMVINPKPIVAITTTPPAAPLCMGDTLPLGFSVNNFGQTGTGQFSGAGVNSGNFIASVAGPGTHTIYYGYTILNSGCSALDSLSVSVESIPKPSISQSGMLLICNLSGFNYQWLMNGVPISGATSKNYTVTGNGSYSVEIDLGNCSEISDPMVISNFGMEELKSSLNFSLFPNPAHDVAYLQFDNPGTGDILYELISINGAVLLRKQIAGGNTISEEINLKDLPVGIYALRIIAGDVNFIERLEKY